jgi:hypothetical protein
MKKKIIFSALVASALLVGCGSSSSSSSSTTENNTTTATTTTENNTTTTSVKVVDAYVIGATVCDAKGTCATTDANGTATAAFDLASGLTSTGGIDDINNNKIADDGVIAPIMKTVPGKTIISPITDLIAKGADKDKLAQVLNINADELCTDPYATNNVELAKAMQIVYAVVAAGKETDFINKINTVNLEEAPTTTDNALEPFKGALDAFTTGEVDTTETTVTGGLETFANLAKEVVADCPDAVALIDKVVAVNTDNAFDVEVQVEAEKKALSAKIPMEENVTVQASAEENATAEMSTETNTTEEATAETNTTETQTTTETNTTQENNTELEGTNLSVFL